MNIENEKQVYAKLTNPNVSISYLRSVLYAYQATWSKRNPLYLVWMLCNPKMPIDLMEEMITLTQVRSYGGYVYRTHRYETSEHNANIIRYGYFQSSIIPNYLKLYLYYDTNF